MPGAQATQASTTPTSHSDTTYTLLTCTLQLAVPLWIERLRGRPWEHIQQRAKVCSDTVAHRGDVILYRGKKRGESAEAFNALAEGIACLSFAPGGVKVFGQHWEACLDADGSKRTGAALVPLLDTILKALRSAGDTDAGCPSA